MTSTNHSQIFSSFGSVNSQDMNITYEDLKNNNKYHIIFEGYAFKQGAKIKSWKKRYFVLTSEKKLFYFAPKGEKVFILKGNFKVLGSPRRPATCIKTGFSEDQSFDISSKERTYHICSESATEWLSKLSDIGVSDTFENLDNYKISIPKRENNGKKSPEGTQSGKKEESNGNTSSGRNQKPTHISLDSLKTKLKSGSSQRYNVGNPEAPEKANELSRSNSTLNPPNITDTHYTTLPDRTYDYSLPDPEGGKKIENPDAYLDLPILKGSDTYLDLPSHHQ